LVGETQGFRVCQFIFHGVVTSSVSVGWGGGSKSGDASGGSFLQYASPGSSQRSMMRAPSCKRRNFNSIPVSARVNMQFLSCWETPLGVWQDANGCNSSRSSVALPVHCFRCARRLRTASTMGWGGGGGAKASCISSSVEPSGLAAMAQASALAERPVGGSIVGMRLRAELTAEQRAPRMAGQAWSRTARRLSSRRGPAVRGGSVTTRARLAISAGQDQRSVTVSRTGRRIYCWSGSGVGPKVSRRVAPRPEERRQRASVSCGERVEMWSKARIQLWRGGGRRSRGGWRRDRRRGGRGHR